MTQHVAAQARDTAARRDARLDLLRLAALVGVIIYQWFGLSWTPIAIPLRRDHFRDRRCAPRGLA